MLNGLHISDAAVRREVDPQGVVIDPESGPHAENVGDPVGRRLRWPVRWPKQFYDILPVGTLQKEAPTQIVDHLAAWIVVVPVVGMGDPEISVEVAIVERIVEENSVDGKGHKAEKAGGNRDPDCEAKKGNACNSQEAPKSRLAGRGLRHRGTL